VVRCRTAGERSEVGVVFDAYPSNPLQALRELVARYARGPASCAGAPVIALPKHAPAPEPAPRADRRTSERRPFNRRIVALQDDAPRVLIGRDLSLGGMSVERGAPIDAGQRLRLALHVRPGEIPLVLDAEVVRTSAAGVGLRFDSLNEATSAYLAKMLDALPALAAPSAGAGEERRVLAELVE
jgi:hypothetical protein